VQQGKTSRNVTTKSADASCYVCMLLLGMHHHPGAPAKSGSMHDGAGPSRGDHADFKYGMLLELHHQPLQMLQAGNE
jgi:hypothetical protein